MSLQDQLARSAEQCARLLSQTSDKLVFAESCTSGLLAATISQIPGISQYFCGSFVTYRESLKVDAIGVSLETLIKFTAVSESTSNEMLAGAISRCSESTLGLAVTGHLGPNAPADLDGRIFIAVGRRNQAFTSIGIRLTSESRHDRQLESALRAFEQLNSLLG